MFGEEGVYTISVQPMHHQDYFVNIYDWNGKRVYTDWPRHRDVLESDITYLMTSHGYWRRQSYDDTLEGYIKALPKQPLQFKETKVH